VSKIYDALKKAEQDRERTRPRPAIPSAARVDVRRHTNETQEEYQRLRASLVSIAVPSGLHTILITAPRHGEGTTTVAIGLARALAKEREARVLLAEANLRTPAFANILPLPTTTGLVDFAAGRVAPEALPMRLEELNLSVVAAGDGANPAVDLDVIDGLLSRLHAQYDFIVVDAAPVNSYADTAMLSTKVDGVILVVEADQTPVADAEAAKRQLDRVGARILGVVLNRRRSYLPPFLESIL
jgi:capsular exopolysaccharide synthesis family protein